MLTTVMCLGFSSYVLLASYQPATEMSINEEEQSAGEKSLTELNSFYVNESHPLVEPLAIVIEKFYSDFRTEIPSFALSPNTPPPNLA